MLLFPPAAISAPNCGCLLKRPEASSSATRIQVRPMKALSTDLSLKVREKAMDEFPIMEEKPGNVVLFHPHIPTKAIDAVARVLKTRWIGQGPLVDEFERKFGARFAGDYPTLAVRS